MESVKTKTGSNLERFTNDLKKIVNEGDTLLKYISDKNKVSKFNNGYEMWYSESLSVIEILLPKRKDDFILYYNNAKDICIRKIINPEYNIFGLDNEENIKNATTLFQNQLIILKATQRRLESSLFDIKQIVQADLFNNELEAATELNKKGFVRGAGAIAGVVLEGHLSQVCKNHNIRINKKNPTINDFNELLKESEIIEVKDWRFIQHLGDLRNLCDHKKEKEPSKQDIEDLINGTDKMCKTLY